MKKSILFAALLCCIVSASAQPFRKESKQRPWEESLKLVEKMNGRENLFTMKLDSVTGEEVRNLYEYDARLNCTKEMRYYPTNTSWHLEQSFENTSHKWFGLNDCFLSYRLNAFEPPPQPL